MVEKTIRFRIWLLLFLSIGSALIIAVRFALIMLSPSRTETAALQKPALAERGTIVDRNGRLLALQTRLWSVTAWKPNIEDPSRESALIAEILKEDPSELSRKLSEKKSSHFLFIKRKTTPTESDAIRKLIDKGDLPGIRLQEELGRHYPMKKMAAPLIGHVGTDNVGLDGIEYAFNRVLAPGEITSRSTRVYGDTVHLTIDMNIQYLVERIAADSWKKNTPDSMMVLVMDSSSAEILAWVSLPSFDPNVFTNSTPNQRINRPLTIAYEPGSVFKAFTWSIFLDRGGVKPQTLFQTEGGYLPQTFIRYNIPPITDLNPYGTVDMRGALIHSSNVAVALASETISKEDFYKSLKNFGFGSPTGFPLPGESHGLLKPVRKWSERSKPTIAIGQEVGVSAVQIIAASTILTNGGVLLQPRVVSRVTAEDGSIVKEYPKTSIREVISSQTAKIMLNLMEQTVESPQGTSRLAAVDGLRISAKSGTAQITDPETGAYSENKFLSSILAIFPTDNPKLTVYIVLENPKGASVYGARTAAPMANEIARAIAPLYGIPLAGTRIIQYDGRIDIENPKIEPIDKILPDLTGYSKRMLLSYLENKDITWTIDGDGWVVFQFPPPGTPIEKGMSVYLELK